MHLQHNRSVGDFLLHRESHLLPRIEFNCEIGLFLCISMLPVASSCSFSFVIVNFMRIREETFLLAAQ